MRSLESGRQSPQRRWLRFSLRTLLAATALIAAGLGVATKDLNRQQRAVRAVRKAGGAVIYNLYEVGDAPWWKRQFVTEDCLFSEKLTVNLSGTHVGEDVLVELQNLPQLEELYLLGANLSEAELQKLGLLACLKTLTLSEATFDEDGLAHLNGLTSLTHLYLNDTPVSDRGLARLELLNLRKLQLSGTQVSEKVVARFKNVHPNCHVDWDEPFPD